MPWHPTVAVWLPPAAWNWRIRALPQKSAITSGTTTASSRGRLPPEPLAPTRLNNKRHPPFQPADCRFAQSTPPFPVPRPSSLGPQGSKPPLPGPSFPSFPPLIPFPPPPPRPPREKNRQIARIGIDAAARPVGPVAASARELFRKPPGTVPILSSPRSKMGLSPSPRRLSDALIKPFGYELLPAPWAPGILHETKKRTVMGRNFENRKNAIFKTAAQKSKLYSKYGRLLYVAAKSGVPDPELNPAVAA